MKTSPGDTEPLEREGFATTLVASGTAAVASVLASSAAALRFLTATPEDQCVVALVFPVPELLAVLLHGSVYDPTYHPFPGGRYDIEHDSLWDEDAEEPEGRAPSRSVGPVVADAPPMRLDLMASHWRRHSSAMAVLVAGRPIRDGIYSTVSCGSKPGHAWGTPASGTARSLIVRR